MTLTPNNVPETLSYCADQSRHLDPPDKYGSTWHNDCQAFAHVARGILDGGFATAKAQFWGMPAELRHVTEDLEDAPVGASLFSWSPTGNPAGHTWIAARPFKSGTSGSWSTDMNPHVEGGVYKVSRNAPNIRWGHTNLGWGLGINGWVVDLSGKNPPKPMQDKHYQRLHTMIQSTEALIEYAQRHHDRKDERLFQRERRHLVALYAEARRA